MVKKDNLSLWQNFQFHLKKLHRKCQFRYYLQTRFTQHNPTFFVIQIISDVFKIFYTRFNFQRKDIRFRLLLNYFSRDIQILKIERTILMYSLSCMQFSNQDTQLGQQNQKRSQFMKHLYATVADLILCQEDRGKGQ